MMLPPAPASFLDITVLFVWVLSNYLICSLKFCRGSALWLANAASGHKPRKAHICLPWVIWGLCVLGLWRQSIWVTIPVPVPVFSKVISLILDFAPPPRGSILSQAPLQSLVTLLSACLFCQVWAQRALDVPDGGKQEVSPAATLSSSDITSLLLTFLSSLLWSCLAS